MNKQSLYQFTVLHYIHDTFTGEFLNVGLALYSQNPTYFRVKLLNKYSRLKKTFPTADGEHYHKYIVHLQNKFDDLAEDINAKQLTYLNNENHKIETLLSQVLPIDDSSIQFGQVQGGMARDLDIAFDDLYFRLVETYLAQSDLESRDEAEVWQYYSKPLKAQGAIFHLSQIIIPTKNSEIKLDHAWKNGLWNGLQPISFDLLQSGSIDRKALQWLGTNVVLNKTPDIGTVYYLLGRPRHEESSLLKSYQRAKDLLSNEDEAHKVKIIEEDEADDFAKFIAAKIKADTSHNQNT